MNYHGYTNIGCSGINEVGEFWRSGFVDIPTRDYEVTTGFFLG